MFDLLPGERLDEVNEKIRLIQKKDGLTFGTDAYMLAAFMRPEPSSRAAELGSGTGIISLLSAARRRFAHIDAFEIQPDFALLGERNIRLNGFDGVITQHTADIREPDEGFRAAFDVVFANPPYMKSGNGRPCAADAKNIARHEESGGIYEFASAAAYMLRFGGKFYCVYRPDRLSDLVDALRAVKLEPKRMTFIYPDVTAAPSAVLCEAKLGGSSSVNVTPPIVIYRDPPAVTPRVMTAQAEEIYLNCEIKAKGQSHSAQAEKARL